MSNLCLVQEYFLLKAYRDYPLQQFLGVSIYSHTMEKSGLCQVTATVNHKKLAKWIASTAGVICMETRESRQEIATADHPH